jgi:hypothetical protein
MAENKKPPCGGFPVRQEGCGLAARSWFQRRRALNMPMVSALARFEQAYGFSAGAL